MSVEEQKFVSLIDRLTENVDKLAETSSERVAGKVDSIAVSQKTLEEVVTKLVHTVYGNGAPGMDEDVRGLVKQATARAGLFNTAKNSAITFVVGMVLTAVVASYITSLKLQSAPTPQVQTPGVQQAQVDPSVDKQKLRDEIMQQIREEYDLRPKSTTRSSGGGGKTNKPKNSPQPPEPFPFRPDQSHLRDKQYRITKSTIPAFYFSSVAPWK